MTGQHPLNPDALTRRDIMAGQIGVWIDEWDDGKADTGHVATHIANRLAENGVTTLAAAQPEGWEQQAKNFMRVIDRLSAENETLKAAVLPEVTSFDPRELNRRGWTCGCEPGNYDTCEECQSACNELADFLNQPEVKP